MKGARYWKPAQFLEGRRVKPWTASKDLDGSALREIAAEIAAKARKREDVLGMCEVVSVVHKLDEDAREELVRLAVSMLDE